MAGKAGGKMGKKANAALLVGGLGLLALLVFKPGIGDSGGNGGGGLLDDILGGDGSMDKGNSDGGGSLPTGIGGLISTTKAALTNPFLSPTAIENYTGFEGEPTPEKMAEGGYAYLPTFGEYQAQYPKATISAADYYSKAGAYELAALTNPQYAFGAQQSRIALNLGKITGREYQQLENQGFVNEQGQAVQPAGGSTTYSYAGSSVVGGGGSATFSAGGVSLGGGWTRSGW